MFQIEMRRAPGITEKERRRRIHQAYEILLSAAHKVKGAPIPKVGEPGASALSNADQNDQRQGHTILKRDLTQVEKA